MLHEYMQQVERFLRDQNQKWINPDDLISYCNRARREVAMRTQSIRRIPPISGPITAIDVTASGNGYTNPTVVISGPDSPGGKILNPGGAQATALAQVVGNQIAGVQVTYGGDGYFQPTATISDPTGFGATLTVTVPGINVLRPFQEEYAFADIPLRTYTQQFCYTPAVFTQLGQGVGGSFLCYPIAAQVYQFEPDCSCLPSPLIDDNSPEAIPAPWTEVIPYFAAHLAYLELQNMNAARMYFDLYEGMTHRYSAYARIVRAPSVYPRRY